MDFENFYHFSLLVEHASAHITDHQERHGSETEVQESTLQEKLTMRDKQLAETRTLVKNLKKREEQLLEKYEITNTRFYLFTVFRRA